MATMQATAVITAIDRASPVFQRVALAAQAVAHKYTAASRMDVAAGAVRTAAQSFALPAAAAMGSLISRTQEFEQALVGVSVANIADNLKDGIVNYEAIHRITQETKEEAFKLSKAMALSPTGFVKAAEAAQKMGASAEQARTLMEMSGDVHIQDRAISQERATEFLGTMGKLFGAEKAGADYNAEIIKITNQWLGVANMARTSASRMEEGLRQFAPLYASFGESFLDTAALVGAGTNAGLVDTETGTALKSLGNRMLNMTHKGRDAMIVSGLWDEIQKEGLVDLSGSTARQAMLNLKQLFAGRISRKAEGQLRQMLEHGERNKLFMDAGYQQRLFALVNRITGAKDAPTIEANQEKVMTAILTGGGRVQMSKIIELMAKMQAEGRLTDAQLGLIGEGRHISRYKALFKMLPDFNKFREVLKDINREFTDAGRRLWTLSDAGQWAATVASVDRALMRLRSSEGVRGTIRAFEKIASAIAEAPQGLVEFGGKALAASVGIGALGLALGGVAKFAALIAASPILKALLIGGGALATVGSPLLMGVDRLDPRDLPVAQLFGSGAPIWTTIDQLQGVSSELAALFSDMGHGVGRVVSEIARLFGADPSGSPLVIGLTTLNATIVGIAAGIRQLRESGAWLFNQGAAAWEGLKRLSAGPETTAGRFAAPALRDLVPRLDVQGEAKVKVENEVRIRIDGPGTVVDNRPGVGTATVPLNTGKTMPDTGPF
jgi:TP901 family phage tail tape measure protein